jgi:cytochrome c peroxidase
MNTGIAAAILRTPDMPLYTLKNIATGASIQTTDPGRALVTGDWSDVGKFKVPNLRGLAARAPYFHNGSQPNLAGVVQFYDKRFQIGFTPQEVTDLTNFLQAL